MIVKKKECNSCQASGALDSSDEWEFDEIYAQGDDEDEDEDDPVGVES
jgi:hypothetical protein